MKYTETKILILLIFAMCISCSHFTPENELTMHFSQDGFIDEDHFQALITEKPEKGAVGLVEKRESAYINARNGIADKALLKMAGFICRPGSEKNGKDTGAILKNFSKYRKYGYIAEEYYNRDASVVLIYRFRKKGLKNEIESIPCRENETP